MPVRKLPPAKHPPSVKRIRILQRKWREPLLTALLAVQIFILFVLPVLRSAGLPLSHLAIYFILLSFAGFAIILSRSRVALIMMIGSVTLNILGIIWRQEHPDATALTVNSGAQILTHISLLWVVSTAVFGPGRTTHHRILGAVVMYLSIGMIFTSLYLLLAQIVPGSFTHVPEESNAALREALNYYSFSTLTTGAFGDILPVHPLARSLANIESICGQLFPATLLARIVSAHGSRKSEGAGL